MTFNTIDEISIPDEDDSVISLEEKEESKSRDNDNEKFVATEPNPIDEVKALAKSETRKMTFWKVFVVVSLLVTGAAVSSSVYFFLERKQEGDFKNQFYQRANTIRDVTRLHVTVTMDALAGLATEVTAHAKKSNSEWPFVTMPFFEVNAHHARKASGIEVLAMCPLVQGGVREQWEQYSLQNAGWIEESRGIVLDDEDGLDVTNYGDASILPFVFELDYSAESPFPVPVDPSRDRFVPVWQFSPPPFHGFLTNYDLTSIDDFLGPLNKVLKEKDAFFGEVNDHVAVVSDTGISKKDHHDYHSQYVHMTDEMDAFDLPHTALAHPIFRELNNATQSDVVALLLAVLPVDRFLADLSPDDADGIYVVLSNSCNQTHTYILSGGKATYLGDGDFHEKSFNDLEVRVPFSENLGSEVTDHYCYYEWRVYPSSQFRDKLQENVPVFMTLLSASVFFVISVAFFVYDLFVHKRNTKIIDAAARSNAIILSLFPAKVRDQLLAQSKWDQTMKDNVKRSHFSNDSNGLFGVEETTADASLADSPPIADLFPECTVMFADIAGFTAWSSVREPAQVFVLLENLYSTFDRIAKKRRVFKVETIGDCYVAAAGLPDPRHDHAVVMSRFAKDCLFSMTAVVRRLETLLGPDTADLALRIGLHSGPVTAGVLRGDRARFQLFGDTVNTAARMESTGFRGKIHLSQDTAEYLVSHGKSDWLSKRADVVVAKGKGEMQTYWLVVNTGSRSRTSEGTEETSETSFSDIETSGKASVLSSKRMSSLIKWNVSLLSRLLKQIIATRPATDVIDYDVPPLATAGENPLDEVVDVISLSQKKTTDADADRVHLSNDVKIQLESFVSDIAAIYKENPFHNFEHASHVAMSVIKLLSRIVAPPKMDSASGSSSTDTECEDNSYGINSDPLTQFACVFSALIHDADHPGVPNAQLIKERSPLSAYYKCRSVAEQNSVDLAWDLFMREDYSSFRRAVCANKNELQQFRQLVVNTVMATDIMDKELKVARNKRWEKAFETHGASVSSEPAVVTQNRKATIVIEHLIQASDVAHTMQHWQVYRKWNERLFLEMVQAYEDGRSEKHPADFWYKGELGFFDFYIIPLAKKLKDCGVFGVSSDEYLNYALKNREEWAAKGRQLVAEMQQKPAVAEMEGQQQRNLRDYMDKQMSLMDK